MTLFEYIISLIGSIGFALYLASLIVFFKHLQLKLSNKYPWNWKSVFVWKLQLQVREVEAEGDKSILKWIVVYRKLNTFAVAVIIISGSLGAICILMV